jgi:hypothetical protein
MKYDYYFFLKKPPDFSFVSFSVVSTVVATGAFDASGGLLAPPCWRSRNPSTN